MQLKAAAATLGAAFFAVSCGERAEGEEANACGGDGVVVSDAWTSAARAGQPVSAAYFTLCNGTGAEDALVGVSTANGAIADAIEIHESRMEDGVMSMEKLPRLSLPAGEAVSLEPGGAHIMLIGIPEAIDAGAAPVLRLEFENAPAVDATLEVREKADDHSHH